MGVLIKIDGATFNEKYIIDKVEVPDDEPVVPDEPIVPVTITDYPVQDGLKGLYDLGGTQEASLVNHAPEPHINTADEKIDGTYTVADDYIAFSGATNTTRMHTYLRLPLANSLTYIVLFRAPTNARVLIGNRSAGGSANSSGVSLRNDGVEFGNNGAYVARTFPAINSDKFAILAMTVDENGLRVVRYTNDALSAPLYNSADDPDFVSIDPWLTGSTGNAVAIAGYGMANNAGHDADIALAAIHEGVMTDEQLTEICAFVKAYGEQKGLTIE